ncbi:MAG: regulatory protein GemA [Xanthomonadaceae bacterium]|nr:regulatory protein GemA [Xanthomonadaceae bacterium]MDP2185044.1 regulatory protein GemA [Xanthomonadales bacterium]MDZ4114423.1 regulatory protein GemA [Xanthomonadaceae bacterium]
MASDPRQRDLARIHIAAKALRLDRDTYVALVRRVSAACGRAVDSSADLDDAGRHALLREFAGLGFKADEQQSRKRVWAGKPKNTADVPMLRKVEAILADAKRPWAYAHAMAKRMHQVDKVEWLNPQQLHTLVAALQVDSARRARRNACGEPGLTEPGKD